MRWFSRAAHPRRIFVEQAQPGNGLARVEQDRAGPGDRLDIGARQRRDPRQMLERVERRALGGEHRARIALDPHQHRPRRDRVAIADAAARSAPRGRARGRRRSAMSSPATTIGSRQFIVAAKRASASIVARLVTSPPEPRSSASTRRTNSARSNCGRSQLGHVAALGHLHLPCRAPPYAGGGRRKRFRPPPRFRRPRLRSRPARSRHCSPSRR